MKTSNQERQDAIDHLRKLLPPGTTVHTVLRNVSRSGMSRSIDCYLLHEQGRSWLSYQIAKATGISFDDKRECLKMGGCGMDMGFAIVYDLARVLYPDGFDCTGERCPSNDHSNGDRNYEPHRHNGDGGYALRQEWL